ncbi:MAG: hypothetical protein ACJA0Q_000517 [Saprospiraceae bacterium]|jgi:hypothetical protein
MKLYTISGLGADERVFKNLDVNADLVHLNWIEPIKNEKLTSYASRLSVSIDTSESFGLLGLSFGGLVAIEMSKILKPKLTILISSVELREEMPLMYRLLGRTGFLKLVPSALFRMPTFIASWLFGTKQKKLLALILKEAELSFYKWAIIALVTWDNSTRIDNCHKIVGEKDRMLPPVVNNESVMIPNGHHFMILDKAQEVSQVINEKIK